MSYINATELYNKLKNASKSKKRKSFSQDEEVEMSFPKLTFKNGKFELSTSKRKNIFKAAQIEELMNISCPDDFTELYYLLHLNETGAECAWRPVLDNKELDISSIVESELSKFIEMPQKSADIWFSKLDYEKAIVSFKEAYRSFKKIIREDDLLSKWADTFKAKNVHVITSTDGKLKTFKSWKDDADKLLQVLSDNSDKLSIVIGEPGTGKTYKAIEDLWKQNTLVISLSNLVGSNFESRMRKKYKDVTESHGICDHMSYTKLRYADIADLMAYNAVVFEEASMLSIREAHLIMKLLNIGMQKIFFLGDVDQLPSFLGFGSILYGICEELPSRVMHLKKNWRQQEYPELIQEMRHIKSTGTFIHTLSTDIVDQYALSCLDKDEDFICVTFTNAQVSYLNFMLLQHVIQKLGKQWIESPDLFDKTVKNVELALDNGAKLNLMCRRNIRGEKDKETGRRPALMDNNEICYVTKEGNHFKVQSKMFKDRILKYDTIYDIFKEDFNLGFACTIHKSQGLEFDYVCYYQSGYNANETRNLAYVGYTRSRIKTWVADKNNVKNKIEMKNIFRKI